MLREMGVDQPDPAAVIPTASSRPSSARTTPRGPPSGALQVCHVSVCVVLHVQPCQRRSHTAYGAAGVQAQVRV